jgi:uncharacterized protein YuzE
VNQCYNSEVDILTIRLCETEIEESNEIRPGVIADFSPDGRVVGFEIMDASAWVDLQSVQGISPPFGSGLVS